MPELPEVEITRRALLAHCQHRQIHEVRVLSPKLRQPLPQLEPVLCGKTLLDIERRGKYLLFMFENGVLLSHLGMSGTWQVRETNALGQESSSTGTSSLNALNPASLWALPKHTHVHFKLGRAQNPLPNDSLLFYHDPRRFGLLLWLDRQAFSQNNYLQHPLLANLGLEPLEHESTQLSETLYIGTRKRSSSIKQILLAGHLIVGVGNIYANESLFLSGIHPERGAESLTKKDCQQLAQAIISVLKQAIAQGGSTLKDFRHVNGLSGYFQNDYFVYGRARKPCKHTPCQSIIQQVVQQGRSSFYCPTCQQ